MVIDGWDRDFKSRVSTEYKATQVVPSFFVCGMRGALLFAGFILSLFVFFVQVRSQNLFQGKTC